MSSSIRFVAGGLVDWQLEEVIDQGHLVISEPKRTKSGGYRRMTSRELVKNGQIGPSSIDLRLGPIIKMYNFGRWPSHLGLPRADPKIGIPKEIISEYKITKGGYSLLPHKFVLGATLEMISIPNFLQCVVNGKSSIGRISLSIHETAGYADPGFSGNITLEMKHKLPVPIILYEEMMICQIVLVPTSGVPRVPYNLRKGSLYRGKNSKSTVVANLSNVASTIKK